MTDTATHIPEVIAVDSLPIRETRRVRFSLRNGHADKLERIAKERNISTAELLEDLIDRIDRT